MIYTLPQGVEVQVQFQMSFSCHQCFLKIDETAAASGGEVLDYACLDLGTAKGGVPGYKTSPTLVMT